MSSETANEAAVVADMVRIFGGVRQRPGAAAADDAANASDTPPVADRPHSAAGWIARLMAPLVVAIVIGIALAFAIRPASFVPAAPVVVATAKPAAPPPVAPPPAEVAAAHLPPPRPMPVAPPPVIPVATAPVHTVSTSDEPIAAHGDCEDARDHDACLYRAVQRADGRLRRAYRRAEAAQVPYREMVRVRRQWDDALDRSLDAPERTIRTYDRLALRLDRARDDVASDE